MSKIIKSVLFISALIILIAVIISLQILKSERKIMLFVTGDTQGYLIPCGCRTSPSGGLSRRVTLMEKISLENKGAKIYPVEIPNVFTDRNPSKDLINRTMGDFFERMNYIVGIGERDLSFKEKLKEYYKGDYYLALNKDFKDEFIIEMGGGLSFTKKGRLHLLFLCETENSQSSLEDYYKKKVSENKDDAFVVLGKVSPKLVEKLVSEKGNLLAVIATWEQTTTSLPQKAMGSWAVFLGDKGRKYATLEVSYYGGKWEAWPETAYIDKDIAPNKEEEEKITKVLNEVEMKNKEIIEKLKIENSKEPLYSGSSSCKDCHKVPYEIWQKSSHFSATKVLEIDHQENNPECLICHSTGFGIGGYPNDKIDLNGIGCESCHGSGKNHPPQKMKIEKGTKPCLQCHTKRDSPFFNDGFSLLIDHTSRKKNKNVGVIVGVQN